MRWRQAQAFDLINHSDVHELVSEIVAPDLAGFTSLARSVYAKEVDPNITFVLKLDSWKGAEHSFSWGVS
jgi:hypothetical protein